MRKRDFVETPFCPRCGRRNNPERRLSILMLVGLVGLAVFLCVAVGAAGAAEPLIDDGGQIAWSGVVVHHSVSQRGNASEIDRWHRERLDRDGRPWRGIGYHFVILRDGTVEPGRSLGTVGAHAAGRNRTHIGICLIGVDAFTVDQREALSRLLQDLRGRYAIRSVERHHEECPGEGLVI